MSAHPHELTIRCGYEFQYSAATHTPAILNAQPRLDPWQRMEKEQMSFSPHISAESYEDPHGNSVKRFVLPPGNTTIRHDVFIIVPPTTDDHWLIDQLVPVRASRASTSRAGSTRWTARSPRSSARRASSASMCGRTRSIPPR